MALEQIGVALVAEGSDNYLNTLTQAAAAEAKLASAAAPAVGAINALDDGMGSADKAAASFAQISALAAANAAKFGAQSDAAGAEVLGLGKDADNAEKGVGGLGDAAQKGGKSSEQLGKGAEAGGKGLSVLQQLAVGAARQIGVLLVNAAQQAGQAILKFVGDSVKVAGDFEAGMNQFSAVVGKELDTSGKSLGDFKDLFISLGRELPVSTADVQQAAIAMSKGGIEPAVIAGGALRQTLQFAAASGLELADAATISAKVLNGWTPLAASAADKAAFFTSSTDLLTKATSAAATNVDSLSQGLFNVQGTAQASGVSFNDTVTTLALLTPSFNSSATAGDSMKNMLSRLQPTTDAASAAMKDLNLLTSTGKSVFYDASGAFVGMRKATDLLSGAFDGLSDAEKSEKLQAIFGNDAKNAANALIKAGIQGYDDITKKIAAQNGVMAQAAIKQQGFNVALDNVGGSLEALQITVGGAVLPALTKLLGLFADGINAVTEYADATIKGESGLSQFAATVQTMLIPALTGVTAALTAYAIVQTVNAIPAIYASIPALAAQAAAFYANAAAIVAALAPYALIAGAVAGVAYAYQNFTSKVSDATTQLLNSRQWWTDSAAAVTDYGTQTGKAKEQLAPYAATIGQLRTQIQGEVEDLGKRTAAGLVSDAQYQTEMATINQHRAGLIQVTAAYNEVSQALIKQTAEGMTATNQAANLQSAESDLSGQTSLTAKDIEDLGKKIEKTFQDGQDAVQQYATTYSEFASGVEQRSQEHADKIAALEKKKQDATTKEQKAGIDDQIAQVNQAYSDQESSAANSYARQQSAQKQHLGQMLIDYTVAQASLGNISKEKAAEITGGLEKEYGLQESSTATTFLHMAGSIDKFASESGGSIDTLIGTLRDQSQQAKDTQKAMDDYAKEYVAKQTNNFLEGKQNADDYIKSLESIPKEVTTTVTTNYVQKGDHTTDGAGHSGTRAVGGPVDAGQSYLVGERGPELVVPQSDGYVLTASETRRAMASGAQLGAARASSSVVSTTIINVDARGSSVTMADITRGVRAGLESVGRSADAQVRTLG